MATKKKGNATPGNVTIAPEGKAPRLKKDGTPWPAPTSRRSNEEMLKVYEERLVKRKADHAKEIERIEKKIAYFKNGGKGRTINPAKAAAAAQDLLSKGMTAEQIIQFAEQARLAVSAIKGKSEDELKALAAPPSFLAVNPA